MGTITFGYGEPPPPPTDPTLGYPPGVLYFDPNEPFAAHAQVSLPFHDGFPYPVYQFAFPSESSLSADALDPLFDALLRLTFNANQLFQSWCQLQTEATCPNEGSFQISDDGTCAVGGGSLGVAPTDCAKAGLCLSDRCDCHHGPCDYNASRTANLTLRQTSDGLIGSLSGEAVFLNERGALVTLGSVRFTAASE